MLEKFQVLDTKLAIVTANPSCPFQIVFIVASNLKKQSICLDYHI